MRWSFDTGLPEQHPACPGDAAGHPGTPGGTPGGTSARCATSPAGLPPCGISRTGGSAGLRRPELAERPVHVACAALAPPLGGGCLFPGDDGRKQLLDIEFGTLLDVAASVLAGTDHPVGSGLGLAYYLCQCPIISTDPNVPAVLGELSPDISVPAIIDPATLYQANLWLGTVGSRSNAHFDANHNLLVVVKGAKRVLLAPPAAVATLGARPAFAADFHHSPGVFGGGDPRGSDESSESHCGGLPTGTVVADLLPGDGLFIPEGWWHQVDSSPGTVAVNFWFTGVAAAISRAIEASPPAQELEGYIARVAVARAVQAARRRLRDEHRHRRQLPAAAPPAAAATAAAVVASTDTAGSVATAAALVLQSPGEASCAAGKGWVALPRALIFRFILFYFWIVSHVMLSSNTVHGKARRVLRSSLVPMPIGR